MVNTLRLLLIAVLTLICKKWPIKLINKYYPLAMTQKVTSFEMNISKIQKRFWYNFIFVVMISAILCLFLNRFGSFTFMRYDLLRISSIIILLTGSLSRLSIIQDYKGDKEIIQVVEESLFLLSQVCGTILLILFLWYR